MDFKSESFQCFLDLRRQQLQIKNWFSILNFSFVQESRLYIWLSKMDLVLNIFFQWWKFVKQWTVSIFVFLRDTHWKITINLKLTFAPFQNVLNKICARNGPISFTKFQNDGLNFFVILQFSIWFWLNSQTS